MNWLEANGVVLRYELSGEPDRPCVVLVHEMGNTLESWDWVAPQLAKKRRVLRYDMRGAGLSEKLLNDIQIEDMADDIAALLDGLDIKGKVAIAGCSLGGAIALGFAGRHPQRTSATVAMSPAAGMDPARRANRIAAMDELVKVGMRGRADEAVESSYPKILQDAAPERFRRYQLGKFANDPESFRALYRMVAFSDVAKYYPAITAPVLCVGGEFDKVRPAEGTKHIAQQIKGARFVSIASGHYMPMQTPELVASTIEAFLDEVERRA